jgi:hypothetical protein
LNGDGCRIAVPSRCESTGSAATRKGAAAPPSVAGVVADTNGSGMVNDGRAPAEAGAASVPVATGDDGATGAGAALGVTAG